MKRINKIAFFYFLIFTALFCMFFSESVFAQEKSNETRINARRRAIINAQLQNFAGASAPVGVPGIERQVAVAPKNAGEALNNFNVLKTVIINPATGQISFIGVYDPKYPTGAIPYAELLKDALGSPYPYFSLGDINKLNTSSREYVTALESDIKRMWNDPNHADQWMKKIISLIMTNGALKDDKTLLVAKLSRDFGITEQELAELYTFTNQADAKVTPGAYRAYGKMLNRVGYADIGEAFASMAEDTPEGIQRCLEIFGIKDPVNAIKAKMDKGEISREEAGKQVTLLFYIPLLERLKMPKNQVEQYVNLVRNGQMPLSELTAILDARMTAVMTAVFGEQVLNNITLSQNLMAMIYPSCKPDEIELIFKDIPPGTRLAKIMYEADYSLKLLNGPSMVRLFPDQVGEVQFHALRNAPPKDQALQASMLNRYWLTPDACEMKISTDKKVISFGGAKVKINEENIRAQGNFSSQSQKESIEAYAAYLSGRYDIYAEKIPAFHELREAVKILALARWLKSQNIKISIPAGGENSWAPPKSVTGRLYGVFTIEDHRPFFTVAMGGVDFTGGDQWINAASDPQVGVKALDQLKVSAQLGNKAADAALAGDMEGAKALAEQSAQAMTGELDITKFQNIKPSAVPATPEEAELYKALSKDTNDDIGVISSSAPPEAKYRALANLKEVQKIYNQAQKSPDKSDELLANYNASSSQTAKTTTAGSSTPGALATAATSPAGTTSTISTVPGTSVPGTPATVATAGTITTGAGSSHISTPSQAAPPPPLPNVPTVFVPVPGITAQIFNAIKNIDPNDNPLIRFLDSPKTAEWIDAIGYNIKQIPSKAFDLAMEVVGLGEYYKVIKINKGLSEEVTKQMDLFMDASNKGFPEEDVKKLQERNNMTAGIAIEELSGAPMPVFQEKESGWHQWFQKKIKKND